MAARVIKFREATFESADGVVSLDEEFRAGILATLFPKLTTPSAPFKGGFAAFY